MLTDLPCREVALFFKCDVLLRLEERISVWFLGNHRPTHPEKLP
jgi:hypothetical protein